MTHSSPLQQQDDRELAARVQQCVRERTAHRLRHLTVTMVEGVLTLRGHAPSYYVKQLALCGALDAVGDHDIPIRLEIEVAPPERPVPPG